MHPYYSSAQLEQKAIKILKCYQKGELLTKPQKLDVDDFAEFFLDLRIDYVNLSHDQKILGCMCFNDGLLEVWNQDLQQYYTINVNSGTVLIDNNLIETGPEGRIRFTLIHECAHWILHRKVYEKNPNNGQYSFKNPIYRNEKWSKNTKRTDEEKREWQANRLGAALIMPEPMIILYLCEKMNVNINELHNTYITYSLIKQASNCFGVSAEAMNHRLRDLNISNR